MEAIINLNEAASVMSGELLNADGKTLICSVSKDSREIENGALFFAFNGENFNGHKFVKDAVDRGAVCAVVNRDEDIPDGLPVIKVKSTNQALLDLAGAYRSKINIPVIAVTGSVGKTSTRVMLGHVLSQKYKTLVTKGNLNNEIGVPLTLFRLDSTYDIAVIEMGMNHFGELSRITAAAKPDTAIITNIGYAHIGNLGSRDGILKAKLEVLEGLSNDGTVILCGDDDKLWEINGTLDFETLYCGTENKKCELVAENVATYADGTEFTFEFDGNNYRARTSVPGMHHVYNALICILAGIKYTVPMKDILSGITEFAPVGMRQATSKINGYTVIKDCYNANPTSMKAGLDVLRLSNDGTRKVACLGDMMELGTISEEAHLKIGKLIPSYDVDCLITVGERAALIAKGAEDAGMSKANIYSYKNNSEVCENIKKILKDNDVILLKASRSMKLEEIADFLEENEKGSENK